MDKSTNIKERVLQVADYKGIAKEKFFEQIGMSYGNFKGKSKKTPLNSNAIADILSIYPEINPVWLLTGEGQMLKENTTNHYSNNVQSNIVSEGSMVYQSNTEEVEQLKQRIEDLEKIIETQKLLIDVLNKN